MARRENIEFLCRRCYIDMDIVGTLFDLVLNCEPRSRESVGNAFGFTSVFSVSFRDVKEIMAAPGVGVS